jgi:hypothetical protein
LLAVLFECIRAFVQSVLGCSSACVQACFLAVSFYVISCLRAGVLTYRRASFKPRLCDSLQECLHTGVIAYFRSGVLACLLACVQSCLVAAFLRDSLLAWKRDCVQACL